MATLPAGHVMRLPDLPGLWQIWSPSSATPGAYFLVPHTRDARESGIKVVTARCLFKRESPIPVITILETEKS
jgi:hypothetical protein